MTRRVPCVPVVVDPVIRAAHGFLYRDTCTGRCTGLGRYNNDRITSGITVVWYSM